MRKLTFFFGFLLLFVFIFDSCKHSPDYVTPDTPGTDPPIDTLICDSTDVSYAGIVYPILETYCISCHSGVTPAGALDFEDFGDVAWVVESGQLLGSIKHESDYSPMPKDAPKLSTCEIALIEKWINDTVIVTPPDTTLCDSSFVTYPGTVYPIFEANCISCHAPPVPEGGIDLTDYEKVAFLAQSGALMGAIRHEPEYEAMPKNAPPLTDCEVELIQIWINDTTFTPPGGGGIPCDPDTVYFQNDILPLLLSSCGLADCHDEQSAEGEVILTSYYYVMQTADVVPFQPWESDLYEKITDDDPDDRMPPPPAPTLSEDQIDMIYSWIAQGALNNFCELEDCDSVNVTFSETVWPIIQNNCLGCHSGPDPNGGISLENYNNVKTSAAIEPGNPGSLLGAITWATGNINMPENGPQLSDCDIAQVRKWIEDGMPDN